MTFAVWSSWRPLVRGLLAGGLAGLMVLGVVAARVSPEAVTGAAAELVRVLRGLGLTGAVTFMVLQTLVAVSGLLPASLLGMAAGAIYGLVPGFLLAGIGVMGGAILAFFLSRSLFRPTVERLASRRPRLRNLDSLIVRDGWKLVCMLRVSPVMPFSATSYMLGLSSIGLRDYAVGTLASLPALCGYVFIGTLADAGLSAWTTGADPIRWTLLAVGGLATLVLTVRSGQIALKLWPASQAKQELALPDDRSRGG